jgi:ATP adenylyltransferase
MHHLWAPWRMEYVVKDKTKECIFCALPRKNDDETHFILFRGPLCFVIMNVFPYNNGHLMVAPNSHTNCLTRLRRDELLELSILTQKCLEILGETYNPNGYNIGMNLGKESGAGFDEHLHNHIVPRWSGDTNFMPVLAEVRVHPEHLRATYAKLRPRFQNVKLV